PLSHPHTGGVGLAGGGVPGRKAQQSGHPTTRQPDTAPQQAPRSGNAPQAQNSNHHGGKAKNVGSKING
ncbi:hypothetical protein, partial [Streptomyces lunalinharesii]|uniref:hypothetical protein n=1 Tax=Streptomyces lunalinharesii TaxID=333384 RepID=UPI0031D09789